MKRNIALEAEKHQLEKQLGGSFFAFFPSLLLTDV